MQYYLIDAYTEEIISTLSKPFTNYDEDDYICVSAEAWNNREQTFSKKTYVIMAYDECNDEFNTGIEVTIPEFTGTEDLYEAMKDALLNAAELKAKKQFNEEVYGFHAERKNSDMSMSEWLALGYGDF